MSRIQTVISDLERTLEKGGLSPQVKASLTNKLKNIKENQVVRK